MSRDGEARRWKPLVTGAFGFVDTQVSVAYVIEEKLRGEIRCDSAGFSEGALMRIAVGALAEFDRGEAAEGLVARLEALQSQLSGVSKHFCRAANVPVAWFQKKMGTRLRELIHEKQRSHGAFLASRTSTDPTHSMLSKDHDDHPLHVIAARCARAAVCDVGLKMRDAWGGGDRDAPFRAALRYLVHPNDLRQVSVQSGPEAVLQEIDAFAKAAEKGFLKRLARGPSIARFVDASAAEDAEILGTAKRLYITERIADRIQELLPPQ